MKVCENFAIDAPGRPEVVTCPRCNGSGNDPDAPRGYQRILSEPDRVLAEQEAIAEGVFG